MSDYSQGKVYKLYVEGLEDFPYIGSTVQTLTQRLARHKYQKSSDADYQFASAVLFEDGNEVKIELLEEVCCDNKQQLLAKEREWLDKFPDAINKTAPICISEEERHERQKAILRTCYYKKQEERIIKQRAYKETHKKELAEKRSETRKADLETARARDKESNAKRDKAKRLEWKNAKVTCNKCQLVLSRNNFPTHKKNKHKDEEVCYTLVESTSIF